MESSSKKRLGCWFSALLERRKHHHGVVAGGFSARAQSALDGDPAEKRRGTLTREGMTLADLLPGECGYISRLAGATQGRLRLLEMGMTPGTHVQVTRAAAFGGPLDVNVRGYQLSLRRDEATLVWLGGAPAEAEETHETGADVYGAAVVMDDSIVADGVLEGNVEDGGAVFAVTVQARTEPARDVLG